MTPAQQATAELHAAFWGAPQKANTNADLPTRRYDMMKQEVKELKTLGMSRLPAGSK